MGNLKAFGKKALPKPVFNFLKFIKNNDLFVFISFLKRNDLNISFSEKLNIIKRIYSINNQLESPHTQKEILSCITTILQLPPSIEGKIVEAGCYKGSSTSKFSIAVKKSNRELFVFDSFEGIPDNEEEHGESIFGGSASFKKGDYCGKLNEVKSNVEKFGEISCCYFIKGWFDDTLPNFNEKIAVAYIDVDLVSSTKTCLKYFYPLLSKGGVLYSQDGHLPLVIELLNNDKFLEDEVGCKKPRIEGLNKSKLIKIVKN